MRSLDLWPHIVFLFSHFLVPFQRDFKSGMERYICKHVAGTVVCFKKAVSLNAKHCYIVEKVKIFIVKMTCCVYHVASIVWVLLLRCAILCLSNPTPMQSLCPDWNPSLGLLLTERDARTCRELLQSSTWSGGDIAC